MFLDPRAHKVAFIHVGEGGERDLEDHLRGSRSVNLQIVSSERLPDIDATDVIHGLDSSGTSRDYVDESHRCNNTCPVGCQGHCSIDQEVWQRIREICRKTATTGIRRHKG